MNSKEKPLNIYKYFKYFYILSKLLIVKIYISGLF